MHRSWGIEMNELIKTPQENNTQFIIEGMLTELHVSMAKENHLEKIDKYYREKNVITGLGAAVGELYGQVAGAASIAMYDGDYTENFMCLIDGQAVCGTFGGASKLPVGKIVKAVVSRHENVLVAEGILSESDGFIWIGHAWGFKAERMANYKIGFWCFLFQLICIFLLCVFTGDFNTPFFWFMMKISIFGAGTICLGVAFWSGSSMNALASPATNVFRMLGFADPERINLNSYQYGIIHSDELYRSDQTRANHGNIHCYKKAITDGKIRMSAH